MKIIGIEDKIGEYEGSPYHNVNIHTAIEFNNDISKGFNTKKVKVKYDVLTNSFKKAFTTAEILNLVGKDVDFSYDEFKNVKKIEILDSVQDEKSK